MLSSRRILSGNDFWLPLSRFSTQLKTDYAVSENARPYEMVPGLTKFQLVRGMLPGGMFHEAPFKKLGNFCRRKYGDLYKLPGMFGADDIVITYNPEHFEKILRTEGIWPSRRASSSVRYFRENFKKDFYEDMHGLLNSNDKVWGNIRTAVNPILMNPTNVKIYFPKVLNANNEFIKRIRDIRDPNTLEVPDDFLTEINRWTFENVFAVALDKELGLIRKNRDNPEAVRAFKLLHRVFELMYDLDLQPPFWKFVKTPAFKEMMSALETLHNFFEKHVDEAIESMDNNKKYEDQSVLQKLIAIDKKLGVVMAMDMLMAGVDTTSTIFSGILLNIAINPDKQEILREEIMNVLPNEDSELTAQNMKNMPYLRACIKESIRLNPLGPGTMRRTNQDLELDGYKIPKGTDIILNTEEIMRESNNYPEPLKYIPERWLRENSEIKAQCPYAKKSENPFVYMPFGFGPRMCIGKRIVDLELEIGLTKILRNYKIEYNYPPEEVFTSYLINTPKAPLRFKFTDL